MKPKTRNIWIRFVCKRSAVQLSYIQYLSSVELVETFCVKDFSLFRERIKQTIQRVFPNVEICFKTCYTVSKAKHPQFLQSLQELQDELNYKLLR